MNTTATAVIMSGQARSFAQCYASQKWQVYRRLPNPHFFVSVVDDEQATDMERLRDDFEHVHIERVTQPDLPEPEEYLTAGLSAPYGNIVPVKSVLRQHWSHARSWAFFKECNPDPTLSFTYVRMRPDIFFHRFQWNPAIAQNEAVHTAWWGSYGGINDRFAVITGRRAAAIYFNALEAFPALIQAGCPFHPETLLGAWLEHSQVRLVRAMDAEFSTKRIDGRPDTQPVYYASDIFRYVEARLAGGSRK